MNERTIPTAPDMSAAGVSARLRSVAALTDLGPRRGVLAKVGADAASVTARLRQVSSLRDLCLRLDALGAVRLEPPAPDHAAPPASR